MKKTKEKGNWPADSNRFVCYMDIMGFKDFVARTEYKEVYKQMKSITYSKKDIDKTISMLYDNDTLFITRFSDSVILFSRDDSKDSLDAISYAAASIFSDAAKNNIPMKGALAAGKIIVDRLQNIYFGQPFIDSFLLQENEVHYYGVICHNSMEKYIESNKDNSIWIGQLYEEIKTPLKSGIIRHYNLNWFVLLTSGINAHEKREKVFNEIIKNFKFKTSGKPRKYIDNTEFVFKQFYPIV